jgi:zinc transport system substrate-binding protein
LAVYILTLAPAPAAERISVAVSVPPQAWLVEQIGGDRVTVQTLVPPGQDPHLFSLTPKRTLELARARVYFAAGLEFEETLVPRLKDSAAALRIVDMTAGIARELEGEAEHGHADDDHGHNHEVDRHVWVTPGNLIVMARHTATALSELDPEQRAAYAERLAAFEARMQALDESLAEALAPYKGQTFYVYHAAWGHLAAAYGLTQAAVQLGNQRPSPRLLRNLAKQAQDQGVRIIFVQPQFDPTDAHILAQAIGGSVVSIDPLAADVEANLTSITTALTEAMSP